MPKRNAPEVNAGSMADIAFLLLIFFLVTSEMTKEAGKFSLLPEKTTEDTPKVEINDRDIIEVLVNNNNDILFEGKFVELDQIPGLVKEMILNADDRDDWPQNSVADLDKIKERIEINRRKLETASEEKEASAKRALRTAELRLEAFEIYGEDYKTSKHVINMQATQGADYETYILLRDKLDQAYTQLRDDLARKKLGRGWDDLKIEEKEMLEMVYKENVSEAPVVK